MKKMIFLHHENSSKEEPAFNYDNIHTQITRLYLKDAQWEICLVTEQPGGKARTGKNELGEELS